MFDKSILNDIRERISIVSFIGERIPLKRAGRNYLGLCPFHQEKTPSFNVSDDKGIYHCFGCGEGGDIFQFVMKFEGGSFADAVRFLAAKAGVTLPEQRDPRQQAVEAAEDRKRRLLLRVNEIAREFFAGTLAGPAGTAARAYLQERGIGSEISTQHFLGYAENGWDALTRHLTARKVPLELAQELGLIKRRDGGGYYDFFRHRVMYPILSQRGETIGFGGRTLPGGVDGDRAAKYLNSPDSALYHKSSCVYGLDRSAPAIRNAESAILVEGYMDFIALHQAGIANVAAPLGTALTAGHVNVLARLTRNMVLIFDGDEAGSKAALRALGVFLEAGMMPRVVVLPQGEDPDTLIRREGANAFRARVERAVPLFEHYVESVAVETGLDSAGKVAAVQRIVPMLKKVNDEIERNVLLQHLSRRLDVDYALLVRSVDAREGTLPGVRVGSTVVRGGVSGQRKGMQQTAERLLIQTMLTYPETIAQVLEGLTPERFEDEWCRAVFALLATSVATQERFTIGTMIDSIEDPEFASTLRAVAMEPVVMSDEEAIALARDCAHTVIARPDAERLESINEEIRRAERAQDDARLMQLLKEKSELASRVRA